MTILGRNSSLYLQSWGQLFESQAMQNLDMWPLSDKISQLENKLLLISIDFTPESLKDQPQLPTKNGTLCFPGN